MTDEEPQHSLLTTLNRIRSFTTQALPPPSPLLMLHLDPPSPLRAPPPPLAPSSPWPAQCASCWSCAGPSLVKTTPSTHHASPRRALGDPRSFTKHARSATIRHHKPCTPLHKSRHPALVPATCRLSTTGSRRAPRPPRCCHEPGLGPAPCLPPLREQASLSASPEPGPSPLHPPTHHWAWLPTGRVHQPTNLTRATPLPPSPARRP